MVATYNEVQDFVREARKLALRDGCRKCGKQARLLELRGDMPLTRLARDGYGIEEIQKAIDERGWFCRGCARGINNKLMLETLGEWKKQQKKQLPEPVNKRDWSDDDKWDYCLDEGAGIGPPKAKAKEVWEGAELEEALKVIREDH